MIEIKRISQTFSYGPQTWRINPDGSWSALAFGSTPYKNGLHWFWINVPLDKVPEEIIKASNKG